MAEITYKSLFESLRKNEDGLSLLFLRSADIRTHQRVANIVRLEIGIINRATNRLQLHPKRQAKLAPKEAKPNPDKLCPVCKGAKTLSLHDVPNINATEQTCDNCNGTGEAKEGQIPYKKPCPHCLDGIILDHSDGVTLRTRTCPECHGSGDLVTEADKVLAIQINAAYEAMEKDNAIAEVSSITEAKHRTSTINKDWHLTPKETKKHYPHSLWFTWEYDEQTNSCSNQKHHDSPKAVLSKLQDNHLVHLSPPYSGDPDDDGEPYMEWDADAFRKWMNAKSTNINPDAKPEKPKRFVQVNWTGRGFSSGEFELVEEKEMYGKCWYRIKVETDVVRHQWLLPEKCKEVVR